MTSRKTAEQLPLAFGHDPATGRDDLLLAEPVNAAVAMIDAWPHWPAPVVIIAGPVGSGKSHLAALWREKAGAEIIEAMAGTGAEEAAERGPVLIEDADRNGFDDRTLFHIINNVRQHGHTLLITSRLWPMSWPVELPDLRSRLKAATVVEIGEPDDELISQVIVKLFADRQLFVDDKLVAFGALFGFVGLMIAVPAAAAVGVLARFGLSRYLDSDLYYGRSKPVLLEESTLED